MTSAGSIISILNADSSDAVVIDSDPWFLRAEFEREGSDLHLTGPEGQELIIRNYFNQVPPPDLVTENGIVLKGAVATQLAGPLAPGQYAQSTPTAKAEPIGQIETATGQVKVKHVDGTEGLLSQGDPVYAGDIVETGADGVVGIVFADESTFSLGEDGRMTLDEMIYDPGTQEGSMTVNMLQGAFTFVSGQVAKTGVDAMTVETPTATIGIRGSASGGVVGPQGGLTVSLLPEIGLNGELTISTPFGTQTINLPGQTTNVLTADGPPSGVFVLSPQQMGQIFGPALAGMPNAGNVIPADIRAGAQQGHDQQIAAEVAAVEAEAKQAEVEAKAGEAQQAETDAQAEAQAADDALAQAEANAAADGSETATAELEAAKAQAAEAQAGLAQAVSNVAAVGAELANAALEVAQTQVAVLQTSPSGAIVVAAQSAGIQLPGAAELDAAQQAVQTAQTQAVQAEQQAVQAEADAAQAQADAQIQGTQQNEGPTQPGDGPNGDGTQSTPIPGTNSGSEGGPVEGGEHTDTLGGDIGPIGPEFTEGSKTDEDAPPPTTGGGPTVPSVTTLVSLVSDTYDFVNNQNDLVVSNLSAPQFVTFGNQAQLGDSFDGGAGNDTINFAGSSDYQEHTLNISNTETVTFANVGATNVFQVNVETAGSTAFTLGTAGTYSISDNTGSNLNQTWTIAATVNGTTQKLKVNGGTGTDVLNLATGTTVVESISGIETVHINGTLTFGGLVTGTTISSTAASANLNLGDADSSVTLAGSDWATVVSGGLDTITVSGVGVSSLQNLETLIGASAGQITLSGNGSQNIAVSGSFTKLIGTTSFDTLTLGKGTNTLSNISPGSGGLKLVDTGGIDNITLDDGNLGISLDGKFETVVSGGPGLTSTFTLAGSTNTIDSLKILQTTNVIGSVGTDSVTFSDDNQTSVTLTDIETIVGGSGNDALTISSSVATTITGMGGADTFTLSGAGAKTIRYTSTADGGDTIVSFNAGAGSDVIQFASSMLNNGTNSTTLLAIDATSNPIAVTENSLFIKIHENGTGPGSLAGAANSINALNTTAISSGEQVIFIIDNDSDTFIYHFTENGTSGVDSVGETGDLVLLAQTGQSSVSSFLDGDFGVF